jgi:hypothetical protein
MNGILVAENKVTIVSKYRCSLKQLRTETYKTTVGLKLDPSLYKCV